jgi:uncharacterized membrane protein YfhO
MEALEEVPLEEIPRYKPENPYNYTPLESAERKNTLKLMENDYPKLPYAWLEMVYDYTKSQNEEELEKNINERRFEVPSKYNFKNVSFNKSKLENAQELLNTLSD